MSLLVASFLAITLSSSSMKIDPNTIEQFRKSNPTDITSRMLLARHYYHLNQFDKAQIYLDEVLKIDASSADAKQLKTQIAAFGSSKKVLTSIEVQKPYTKEKLGQAILSLHKQQKYLEQISIYELAQVSNIALNDKPLLVTARYFGWDGQYENAENALKQINAKTGIDYLEEYGKLCSLTEKYDCAIKSYKTLYNATQNQTYGMKLLKFYWNAGRFQEAERLFYQLRRRNPDKNNLAKFDKQIGEMRKKRIDGLKKKYQEEPSLEHFLAYISGLTETDQADKAALLIEEYLKENQKDPQVHFQLATRLSWLGKNERAIEVLRALLPSDDKTIHLRLGEIYAWSGQFDKAVDLLKPLTEKSDKNISVTATRTLAYTYLWSGSKDKAKHYFRKTLALTPEDSVAKEELMILDGNVKPLLKKYLKRYNSNKSDVQSIRKLASFYQVLDDKKNALAYLERLNKIQPGNLNTQKELGQALVGSKQHYRGFGLLEKYAYQKNTSEALFSLAQQYYWAGFNDEAKDVVDDLLRLYPDNQAAYALKAEILKSNPRFVSDKNSQSGWQKYEKGKSEKQVELADRLYFAEFYKSSIPYYEEHLKIAPDDYEARYRYAFALQHSKMHREAAGEFYLMFWQKKNIELRYHYAYNLELMGRTDEAYKEYLQILDNQPKPMPNFLNDFLVNWKQAWESQDLETYSTFYSARQRNDTNWRIRKELSFKNSSFIAVAINDPQIIKQKEGEYTLKFHQEYASGRLKDSGYKTLQVKCVNFRCFITKERWKAGDYREKNNSVFGFVKERVASLESKLFKIQTPDFPGDVIDGPLSSNEQPVKSESYLNEELLERNKDEQIANPAILDFNSELISQAQIESLVDTRRANQEQQKLKAASNDNPAASVAISDLNKVEKEADELLLKDPQVAALKNEIASLRAEISAAKAAQAKKEMLEQLSDEKAELAKLREQQKQRELALHQEQLKREQLAQEQLKQNQLKQQQLHRQKSAANNQIVQSQYQQQVPRTVYQQQIPPQSVSPYGVVNPVQPVFDQYGRQILVQQPPVQTQRLVPIQNMVVVGYDAYQRPIYSVQQTYQYVPNVIQNPQPVQLVPTSPQYGVAPSSPYTIQPPPQMLTGSPSINQQPAISQQKKNEQVNNQTNLAAKHHNRVEIKTERYKDINDVDFNRKTLSVSKKVSDNYRVKTAISQFKLEDQNGTERGKTLQAGVANKNLTIGIKVDKLEEYDVKSAYANYQIKTAEHSFNIAADRVPLPLFKYSVCSGQNKLHATRLRLTDYTEWEDKSMFWGAIDVMEVNDDERNTIITPQFDYRFDFRKSGNLSTNFSTSGWYQTNSDPTDCYYSPENFDSTYLGFHLDYNIAEDWLLKTKISAGYSFSDDVELYQYGVWLESELNNGLAVDLGCYKSNSGGKEGAVGAYGFYECQASLRYDF